jgi:ABC-type cobalamin/Fe3+-siderophores transport system ATPase subunit
MDSTGRMLGEIRESDDFELVLYLLGTGGSGKSTFLESVLGCIYNPGDVCHAGANAEQVFGLEGFVGKFLATMDETAKKMGLNQQDFQVRRLFEITMWASLSC